MVRIYFLFARGVKKIELSCVVSMLSARKQGDLKGVLTTQRIRNLKAQEKSFYNKIARWYTFLAGRSESKYIQMGLEKLSMRSGETALEIGFGTGKGIIKLAEAVGKNGKVYGLDISMNMIRITRSRVHRTGLGKSVMFQIGDGARLPFKSHLFHALFMSFTLELFDPIEIPMVLKECRRVLRKEGRLCVVAMSQKGCPNIITKLYTWAHRTFPNYIDCRPIPVRFFIDRASFQIDEFSEFNMWGLPVEIVLARKKNEPNEIENIRM